MEFFYGLLNAKSTQHLQVVNKLKCGSKNLQLMKKLVRLPDQDALLKLLTSDKLFDFCHYDSDKSYDGKIWALPKIWNHMRDNGLIVCYDISHNLAFKDFCESLTLNPIIVKTYGSQVEKFVGIVLK